jgi:hypothetical protein
MKTHLVKVLVVELKDKLSWLKREIIRVDGVVGEDWLNNLRIKEKNLTNCISNLEKKVG